ncbi:unnamed protein product, partial [Chrysoparadoxa australica]
LSSKHHSDLSLSSQHTRSPGSMSFAPTKGGRRPSGASQKVIKSATFSSRPSSASSSVHRRRGGTNDRQGVMSVEDFTKQ